ncbi:hypothetical protein CDL15_Pgr009151 [Punica granatum]|uniref:Uncharacterized protein n=1 Tax=Punica granatum TaxID=22663 RepID=A0A218WIL6_PUNGR|nr:hypothetical protein CDL15_Pgr009151 [Punica granatum]
MHVQVCMDVGLAGRRAQAHGRSAGEQGRARGRASGAWESTQARGYERGCAAARAAMGVLFTREHVIHPKSPK